MPRPKGLPRTGGRQKGTPNKRTELEIELVQKLGGHVTDLWTTVLSRTPSEFAQMFGIENPKPEDLFGYYRFQLEIAKEAASYVVSKMPQRVALGGDPDGLPLVPVRELSTEEARRMLLEHLGSDVA